MNAELSKRLLWISWVIAARARGEELPVPPASCTAMTETQISEVLTRIENSLAIQT